MANESSDKSGSPSIKDEAKDCGLTICANCVNGTYYTDLLGLKIQSRFCVAEGLRYDKMMDPRTGKSAYRDSRFDRVTDCPGPFQDHINTHGHCSHFIMLPSRPTLRQKISALLHKKP